METLLISRRSRPNQTAVSQPSALIWAAGSAARAWIQRHWSCQQAGGLSQTRAGQPTCTVGLHSDRRGIRQSDAPGGRCQPADRHRHPAGHPTLSVDRPPVNPGALPGCPRGDDLMLAVTELATNCVMHSASGQGGSFTVRLRTGPSWARIEVTDDGPADSQATVSNGWGLAIVSDITDRAGAVIQPNGCRTAWAEASWLA
jgi:hypothetical protein